MSEHSYATGSRPVALVTGAARGIGRAIVQELGDRGIVTIGGDVIDPEEWGADHPADHRLQLDVRSEESVAAAVDLARSEYGRLDHLVNNAAVIFRGPAEETPVEDFARVIDVNLTGPFRTAKAAFPLLVERQGSIVNIASTNALVAAPTKVAYCASKGGLAHMTRTLAKEWGPRGVRVNAVAPTLVETEINAEQRADPEWLAEKLANIPTGRAATTREIATAVAFLLSSDSGSTTGQVLAVDGGATV